MTKLVKYRFPDPEAMRLVERTDIPHLDFYLASDVDKAVEELQDKVIEAESLLTVLGHYICDTCNFMQISSILHVQDGGISPDHTIPICPNDKKIMRSLTWKESALCSQESIKRYMKEISTRETELDALKADLDRVTAELEKANNKIKLLTTMLEEPIT